ncbi:MAG: alpha/beta fold hydrolase [Halanaerobiales bacterium]
MFDILNNKPKINPLAHEVRLKGAKSDLAILIHGYTGCPREMKNMGELLYDRFNFSILIPRLPGHGTNSKDFRTTDRKDWLRKIYEIIINNENEYQNIHLIGLSMGSLISMLSSIHFDIKSLFLISPALYSKNRYIIFSHILKYIKPVLSNDYQIEDEIEDPDLIDLLENYSTQDYTKQISELHKLMLETRKILKDIKSDVKIVHSKKDKIVPLKSAHQIYNNIGSEYKKISIFENSPHVINYGAERDKLLNELIKFYN